jgi:hypothetical protein
MGGWRGLGRSVPGLTLAANRPRYFGRTMRTGELNPPRKLSANFLRALGWACPAQIVLVGVWLAVPRPHTAH